MRIAAIDLGSNSFHMLVVDVRGSGTFDTVLQEKMMIQLGRTALVSGRLDTDSMRRGLECLDEFRRLALARRVERTIAVATSAIREAENGEEFLRRAREKIGIQVRVISGREEARLIHLAVSRYLNLDSGRALLVDIGGGSVELTVADAAKIYYTVSQKAGFLRLHGRFVSGDTMKKREQRAITAYLNEMFAGSLAAIRRHSPVQVIGTSGSMTAILRLAQQRRGEDARLAAPSSQLSRSEIRAILDDMVKVSTIERVKRFDLDPLRAEYLPTALLSLDALLEGLSVPSVNVCPVALREGIIYDFLNRAKPAAPLPAAPGDLRLQSVLDLATRCDYPADHSLRVAQLAEQIFQQTTHLHGLSEREGRLLHYAGILHDIGYYIGYSKHHKHAYYLVMNCDLRGFTPEERNIIANLVRYHRRATPKNGHAPFAALTSVAQKQVKRLSAILRIADALDRSHFSLVQEVRCRSGRKGVQFQLVTGSNPAGVRLDIAAAKAHARYFERLFGVETSFSIVRAGSGRALQQGRATAG